MKHVLRDDSVYRKNARACKEEVIDFFIRIFRETNLQGENTICTLDTAQEALVAPSSKTTPRRGEWTQSQAAEKAIIQSSPNGLTARPAKKAYKARQQAFPKHVTNTSSLTNFHSNA